MPNHNIINDEYKKQKDGQSACVSNKMVEKVCSEPRSIQKLSSITRFQKRQSKIRYKNKSTVLLGYP